MTMYDRAETIRQMLRDTPGCPEATGAARRLLIEAGEAGDAAEAETLALEAAKSVLEDRAVALAGVVEETEAVGHAITLALGAAGAPSAPAAA